MVSSLCRIHVNISVGDTVQWTWANSGHSVTSGTSLTRPIHNFVPLMTRTAPPEFFPTKAQFTRTLLRSLALSYLCDAHCAIGMNGVVNVSGGCAPSGWSAGPDLPSVGPGWLAFIFRPTGTFTAWAAAPLTQLAASSLPRLNMIQHQQLDYKIGRLTPTRIQTTWLVAC